jgi:hypothetical protein
MRDNKAPTKVRTCVQISYKLLTKQLENRTNRFFQIAWPCKPQCPQITSRDVIDFARYVTSLFCSLTADKSGLGQGSVRRELVILSHWMISFQKTHSIALGFLMVIYHAKFCPATFKFVSYTRGVLGNRSV